MNKLLSLEQATTNSSFSPAKQHEFLEREEENPFAAR